MRLLGETDYNDYEGCTGEIRRNSDVPIIILTALGDVSERITGLY